MRSVILALALLVAAPGWAAVTPGTKCGEAGTGYTASQPRKEVTRTAEEAAKASVRVGSDGYWWTCKMPVPEKPPLPCRMSSPQVPSWYDPDTGLWCRSAKSISGPLQHGDMKGFVDNSRDRIGYARYQCDDGIFRKRSSWCAAR
jgi:hypothetical protein